MPEMEDVIAGAMVDQRLARDARQRASDAATFRPDPSLEGFYRQADPPTAAAEMGVAIEFAHYSTARAAAVAAGTFTPDKETAS